ncbi:MULTISPECIES: tRNA uridine-5-carboxymethylaminomethyl(34) synthesis GTPase MnmE [unclassified Sphingomonas]|uniref:tRNA uridine-5-carboxymethylaminomethyl(34) synthesis GTPase MnmE n=1 Tax=unclassified Sphingomonas TaxID=196159 RepID=UPI0006F81240|nr:MULTISPECIES: tRNA uridine-5-carboxymethylaminomethyl(34) synthesis GTPase MnmE [unclassified Sphingomonas]KQM26604.1 tRNA modification GTPase TrmE [Sphingomonas sp. Leaf9]KQM43010.1 tRNA modification GTPase TrmE [Sphingomonas sp. Leaf11]
MAADTIFAVSSGRPPAAIAVLRVSGAGALEATTRLAGSLPPPRRAAVRALRDPVDNRLLDRALVLVFPGPATATGEDLVELHLHGGRAVVASVERALGRLSGLRAAEPGEFTRRALAHGRIDLTEAEGLGDLLSAETEAQRQMALANSDGRLRRAVAEWTATATRLSAVVEAVLDHADEDDVDAGNDVLTGVRVQAGQLARAIGAVLAVPPVERLRDGIRVVLAGPPNTGKSTLLNALVGREAAIVSPMAGTTRDVIEIPVTREGVAWLFLDTAGLRDDSDDPIERIGIARAEGSIAGADVLLWLGDDAPPATERIIALHPRSDIREAAPDGRIAVSAATGDGIDAVWSALAREASLLLPKVDDLSLNRRQAQHAGTAAAALERAAMQDDPLLLAEELRYAVQAFAALTGMRATEAVLDDLFGRFCIGK